MAIKLEKHMVLNKYFLSFFGFNDFKELGEKLKDTQEGYDNLGRSYFIDTLIGLKPEWENLLLRYDYAIKEYVKKLEKNRSQIDFKLKYFQYLAVLFTEIFLDKYYNDRQRFLNELNAFLQEFNSKNRTKISPFTEEDLKKLAFWMATGSGKTLIMHINYWQILKYSKNNWDNIILITPNEGLSKQHQEELKLSGIPFKLYDGNSNNLKTKDREILIIDIHKLTKEKKGEGVSVDISYFEGKNLVFIDEGHKGQKSEEQRWKKLREEIAKEGFLYEYSATFGQVIGKNKDLLEEYSKAIIFDYSYKYFYKDGYGKDFYVYNIKSEKKDNKEYYSQEKQNLLFTAGLLSFYEQLAIFEKHKKELKEYNIEKPLWIFVGSKVIGKGVNSDVVKVIKFIDAITKNKEQFKENVDKILSGESGLINNEGNDIFKNKFKFIRNLNLDALVEDIYQKIFNGNGKLELYEIKNSEGEIGLKTTGEKYFGVINVGDVKTLKKLISESKIEIKEDHFTQSLFFDINKNNSHINILIGSKKFIEGWNSWRVSNMGLINMGKGEGPQIIQLFGRGVRLKGKDYSLRREENPDYELKVLQTLFIFGLNADYINAFLATIEREEVDYEEIEIPIKFNKTNKWEKKIYTIKTKDDFNFLEYPLKLEVDEKILRNIKIDLRPKITTAEGLKVGNAEITIDKPLYIQEKDLNFIDWDFIYSEVMNYKITEGMYNLIIDIDTIKNIIKSKKYKIFLNKSEGIDIEHNNEESFLKILSFEGIRKFNEIILMVIKDYILKSYRREEKRKTMDYLEVEPLTIEKHPSMYPKDGEIIIKIPKSLEEDIEEIMKQLNEYDPDNDKVPQQWKEWDSFVVHLDNHLCTPLIVWKKNKDEIKSIPVKLNEGETKFVEDLKNFLENNSTFKNDDIFLLRNLSRKGIGFFITSGFYPDFVMWIKREYKQHIIFIDPKGIRNLGNFNDEKIQLCTFYIKEIEKRINKELNKKGETLNIQLDAFILSTSSYDDIKGIFGEGNYTKEDFEKHNILFQEDRNYIKKIFKKIGIINN
ncbi:DEAD/DEAH box helicase family protein [Methanothermococcus sp. SCGC AD-155-M21]|nr:DEAD/DEAH box helicase family protein [Methanothermococcus sp. SCGC AD-155-M21]